jgi:PEP-CTERM motif
MPFRQSGRQADARRDHSRQTGRAFRRGKEGSNQRDIGPGWPTTCSDRLRRRSHRQIGIKQRANFAGVNDSSKFFDGPPKVFSLVGTAAISTGPASSYVAAGNTLTAQYLPGGGIEVEVDSAQCVGGTMPGICLQGILNNNGQYTATLLKTGSFQALFTVTYVSPYIPSLFGDPNAWMPTGSDSLTTSVNQFTNGGNTDTATLGGGSITYQRPVPEPATLALLGTGILGLAGAIRHKRN